jgi:hypothetical protein
LKVIVTCKLVHFILRYEIHETPDLLLGCLQREQGKFITGPGALIGNGVSNTYVIDRTNCSPAAELCAALELNGYDDWVLPSINELTEMFLRLGTAAPAPNTNIGGFSGQAYWSSTEYNADNIWRQYDFSEPETQQKIQAAMCVPYAYFNI